MRLLNTKTLRLQEFVGGTPPYAILSHTWGNEEVIRQDLLTIERDPDSDTAKAIRGRNGYSKIERCCYQATSDDLEWAWVDTCCIDKTSSAELSEAINSMYRWYRRAALCYVHLADVEPMSPGWHLDTEKHRLFDQSRWFTRGWTLQELIAPVSVTFFAKDWSDLGSRFSLENILTSRTGVPARILRRQSGPAKESAAERMSWAASRETTREEDTAYCLLGIFDIHMPLLYGEGGYRAFRRLQEEIWRRTEDITVLLWARQHGEPQPSAPGDTGGSFPWSFRGGVLAFHPSCFRLPMPLVPPQDESLNTPAVASGEEYSINSWDEISRYELRGRELMGYISDPDWIVTAVHGSYERDQSHASQYAVSTSALTPGGLNIYLPVTPGDASDTIRVWTLCKFGEYNVCLDLKLPRDEPQDRQALLDEPGARFTLGRVFGQASLALVIPPSAENIRRKWLLRSIILSTEIISYPQLSINNPWYGTSRGNLIELQCAPLIKCNVLGWYPYNATVKRQDAPALQYHAQNPSPLNHAGIRDTGLVMGVLLTATFDPGTEGAPPPSLPKPILVLVARHFHAVDTNSSSANNGFELCCHISQGESAFPTGWRSGGGERICDGEQSDRCIFPSDNGIFVASSVKRWYGPGSRFIRLQVSLSWTR